MTHYICAFFSFRPLNELESIATKIESKAEELGIKGLLILGPEGINTTCSATSLENLNTFKSWMENELSLSQVNSKYSESDVAPFRRYKVKIRDEICTTGIPGVMPPEGKNYHLTPAEWNEVLKKESDWVMIDTRNWYEYQMGTFKGAVNPNIEKFTDFPDYIEKQGIPKDKKMLIFCTGGIRCEKGILALNQAGYENVYQLEGGILNYLKEYPNDQFEGECFVFDHRVGVDQNLKPSKKFGLCPHCGQPASETITCVRCDHPEKVCDDCLKIDFKKETCSKNCAHQWSVNPGKKGKHQIHPFELEQLAEKQGSSQGLELRVTRKKVMKVDDQFRAKTS